MIITDTTRDLIEFLGNYPSDRPSLLINDIAKELDCSWNRARTAVTKLLSLGLMEIMEQSWTGRTFYHKCGSFRGRMKYLRETGRLDLTA